ncbi:hypothetical protein HMPREF0648_1058 [Prevotella bivia JCVIHMP010]|nr:hypothetical protein HMPREF0648_1058 [Prevotella bivia JCVIHMP010]
MSFYFAMFSKRNSSYYGKGLPFTLQRDFMLLWVKDKL